MQRCIDGVDSSKMHMKNDSEAPASAPYQSSLGERSYYPSTMFKRRASSVPLTRETESSCSTQKPRVMLLAEKTQRLGSGKSSLMGPGRKIPKVSPLLGRYKQTDRSTTPQRTIENYIHQSTSPVSSVPITDSNTRKSSEHKQRTTASCLQVLEGSTEVGGKSTGFKRNVNPEKRVCNACPDDSCIHSRQTILEYVDLKRELRECYSTLQDQGTELEELHSQLQFLKKAKNELESRLLVKTDNIEAESAREFQRIQEEWWKQERDLKECIKDLAAALEQERLDHSRTRSEFESAQTVYLQTTQHLERLRDTFDMPSMHLIHRESITEPSRPHLVNTISPEKRGTASVVDTPTPRRRPPPVPLGLGVEGDLVPTVDDSFPHGRALYSTQSNLTNTVESTLINISDPSLAHCDYSNNFSLQTNIAEEVEPFQLIQKLDVDDGDGVTQRETEEGTTEGDGRASSGDIRNPLHVCDFSSPASIQPFAIPCNVHFSSTHPFDHLAGQESLLCRELLRALLDKEKQLTEVILERKELEKKLALLSE